MKIAITGGHGYIGSALCKHFGASQVVRLSRSDRIDLPGEYRYFDLHVPPARGLLAGVEVLIHAAHDFTPCQERMAVNSVNVRGTLDLYEIAALHGVKQIVFISSMAAFKGCHSEYGRIKWELELATLARGGAVVRPGTVWSEQSGGLMGSLERIVSKLPVVPVFGPRSLGLYLVHLNDLVTTIDTLIAKPRSEIISCAAVTPHSLREILALIAQRQGLRRCFVPVPSSLLYWPLRIGEMMGVRGLPRSDSIVSFLNPNPAPDWASFRGLGVVARDFS